jgi:hypothetical protein
MKILSNLKSKKSGSRGLSLRVLKVGFFLTLIHSVFFFSGCKKAEDKLPPPPPVNYCTDGIMNNGETGVDCGGTCDPCADAFNYTLPFYLQFRENSGSFVFFQDDEPSHNIRTTSGTTVAETYFPLWNSTHGFGLKFKGSATSLIGQNLSFDYNATPSAKMIFFDNNGAEFRTSYNVIDQTGSNCYVESVTLISSEPFGSNTLLTYAVRGNFNCKVAEANGSSIGYLTYGKFSIKLIDFQ